MSPEPVFASGILIAGLLVRGVIEILLTWRSSGGRRTANPRR